MIDCHNVDTSTSLSEDGVIAVPERSISADTPVVEDNSDTGSELCIVEEFEQRRRRAALDSPRKMPEKEEVVKKVVKDKIARLTAIVARHKLII